jgi:glycosyltransferase involved in cell wall biosynthesis
VSVRVLQLAPLWFPVGRRGPGGIETFLAALIPALEAAGAEVTLIASADSDVSCRLVPAVETALYEEMRAGRAAEYEYFEQHALREALALLPEFDVVHSHVGPSAYLLSAAASTPVLHTVHSLVGPDLAWYARRHPGLWLSTVSAHQALPLGGGARVIPNGVALDAFPFSARGGDGLAFLGRLEPAKGADLAIAAARTLDRPLTLAGPVIDAGFFAERIEPALGDGVTYAGVLDHARKVELLASAACALVPSRWPEPFGLVAVEAMACGTPVAALATGALPEIVEPGLTGELADDEGGLATAADRARRLDRRAVRARSGERFGIARVAERYLDLYEEMT